MRSVYPISVSRVVSQKIAQLRRDIRFGFVANKSWAIGQYKQARTLWRDGMMQASFHAADLAYECDVRL